MSTDAENALPLEKSTAQIQRGDDSGIIERLRAVIRPTMPAKQAELLHNLRALANAPGFSRASLVTAISYLLEADTVVAGVPPSEYGLQAHWSIQDKLSSDISEAVEEFRMSAPHCPKCGSDDTENLGDFAECRECGYIWYFELVDLDVTEARPG